MNVVIPSCLRGAAVCCLFVGLAAQNTTVPASMNGVEGGGGTNIPFGGSLACRYQCIYDKEELPWTGPYVITGVNVRPDFGTGAAVPAKGFLEISVLMSTTSNTSATASGTFEENYGPDATWVIQNRIMQLPAQPMLAAGPRPANIPFVFSVPWAYGLTPSTQSMPAPDNLLIEIWIHSQPSGSYRVDNLSSCIAPTSTFGTVGPACTVPNNAEIELTGDLSMQAGSSYTWRIANALPSMPFLLALNLSNPPELFGNPAWLLPYPMFDPANPALPSPAFAAAGLMQPATDCYLNISPAAYLGGVTGMNGQGEIVGNLPPGREFVGTTFYAQALVLAPTSNPLLIITSLGRETTVCGPLGVTRIYAFYNNAAMPPPPATGPVQYGVGLVLDVF